MRDRENDSNFYSYMSDVITIHLYLFKEKKSISKIKHQMDLHAIQATRKLEMSEEQKTNPQRKSKDLSQQILRTNKRIFNHSNDFSQEILSNATRRTRLSLAKTKLPSGMGFHAYLENMLSKNILYLKKVLADEGNKAASDKVDSLLCLTTHELNNSIHQLNREAKDWSKITIHTLIILGVISRIQRVIAPQNLLELVRGIESKKGGGEAYFFNEIYRALAFAVRIGNKKMNIRKLESAKNSNTDNRTMYKEINLIAAKSRSKEEAIRKYYENHKLEYSGSLMALRQAFYRMQREMKKKHK